MVTFLKRLQTAQRAVPYSYLVALAAFPLLILAVNTSWVFPPVGWLDPWIYSGYHMHFKMMWDSWPNEYYGSRVPWTVLGFVVHRFFSPGASLIVLALVLFYASTYSLFYAIYGIFKNAAAGFVAACLLGTNSWFLLAIGWNYVDGPSIACTLLSVAALVATTHGERFRSGSLFWGALSAVLIALYPLNLVFIPVELLLFLGLDRLANRRASVRLAALWSAGFAGATFAMGLANWSAGGKFDFIGPTIRDLHLVTPAGTNYIYVVPWRNWLPEATWLLVPAIAFAASVAFVIARRETIVRFWQAPNSPAPEDEESLLVLAIGFIVTACGFILMQVLQFSVLAFFFRANAILPFAYLAFGGFIAVALLRGPRRITVRFALAAAFICFTPWLLGYLRVITLPLPAELYSALFNGRIRESLWILAGAAFLLSTILLRYRAVALLSVALLSILNVATVSPGSIITLPQDTSNRDRTLATFAASEVIDKESSTLPAIWWDRKDPANFSFSSLAIMYLDQTPAINAPDERVVFIRSSRFRDLELLSPFSDHPPALTGVRKIRVQRGATSFDLIIGTVKKRTPR
jgi:hypothetical protein